MINFDQTIPCPVCGTKIHFNTRELLKGVKFTCSNCSASIGLSNESKPLVQDVMDKFDNIKKDLSEPDAYN